MSEALNGHLAWLALLGFGHFVKIAAFGGLFKHSMTDLGQGPMTSTLSCGGMAQAESSLVCMVLPRIILLFKGVPFF